MAGKPALSKDLLQKAVAKYCAARKLEFSTDEPFTRFLILPDVSVSIQKGEMVCTDQDAANGIRDAILDFLNPSLSGLPAVVEEADSTKIMGLLAQVPGYMPEITLGMVANLVHCPNANAEDLIMLAVTAKNIGANPFLPGEIFLIKPDSGKSYTVVGQTLIAKKLSSVPGFQKSLRGIITETKEGVVAYKKGLYYNPKREELTGAWSEIYYDNRETVRHEVALHEVMGNGPNWKKSPGLMCAKCCFMQNARIAEPDLIGNCYDYDEMPGRMQLDPKKEIVEA